MTARRWLALLAAALTLLLPTHARSGNFEARPFVLFSGAETDSTEQASRWFPCFGATRIIVRTWSGKAAFNASTDADSTFSDSLTTFTILLSDSAGAAIPGQAADSIVFNPAVTPFVDTSFVWVGARPLPINKQLRAPSNGSGLITIIYPPLSSTVISGAVTQDAGGFIAKHFMRIRCTPLRRMTVTGSQSTAGKRVTGLRAFRMTAQPVFANK